MLSSRLQVCHEKNAVETGTLWLECSIMLQHAKHNCMLQKPRQLRFERWPAVHLDAACDYLPRQSAQRMMTTMVMVISKMMIMTVRMMLLLLLLLMMIMRMTMTMMTRTIMMMAMITMIAITMTRILIRLTMSLVRLCRLETARAGLEIYSPLNCRSSAGMLGQTSVQSLGCIKSLRIIFKLLCCSRPFPMLLKPFLGSRRHGHSARKANFSILLAYLVPGFDMDHMDSLHSVLH